MRDVSLAIGKGEILAVLGHSGCGKSTLLRAIAGLVPLGAGEVAIGGALVSGARLFVQPERRNVGMMFQDVALFPHMNVLANVRFGLGSQRERASDIARARLRDVGLETFAEAYPATLSGGEAQRVALARALAPEPEILLLDEPFANLDPGTRASVQTQTLALLRRSGMTAILVTHDRDEAFVFADRIAIMHGGSIEQVGTARELYHRPSSPAVARALGEVIECVGVVRGDVVETPFGAIACMKSAISGCKRVFIRPEALAIAEPGNGVSARILRRTFMGAETELQLSVNGMSAPFLLRVFKDVRLEGDMVTLNVDLNGVMLFDIDES